MNARQRWIFGATQGLAFGLPFGLFANLGGHLSVTATVVAGLSAGIAFGGLMTWATDRTLARLTAGIRDGLTAAELKQVLVASVRGPLPSELPLVAAAAEISRRRVAMVTRHRRVQVGARIVLGAAAAVLAVTLHPLWWFVAALMALGCVLNVQQVGKLRQQEAVLAGVVAALRPVPLTPGPSTAPSDGPREES